MGQSWMLRTETTLWLLSGTVHPPTRYVGQSGWRVLQSRELSMTGAPQLKTQSCSATGHSCAKDWQAFAIRGRAGTVPCAAAGNVRVQPHRLESCWEAQVLIWNAELVSISQGTGSKVFATLLLESPGAAQSEGGDLNVCLLRLSQVRMTLPAFSIRHWHGDTSGFPGAG